MAAVVRFLGAVVIGLGLVVGVGLPARAAPGDLTPEGTVGMEQIATCLRSNPNLAVLLVVDESGSLAQTDPANRRAEILADLVSSLADLSGEETASGPREVKFAVNTFAEASTALLPWTSLTEDNAGELSASLEAQLPGLNQGLATNYEGALTAAASTMAEGAASFQAEVAPCQLVIWFTDGVLRVGSDQEDAASARRLCEPDGPVDALRAQGVHLISVLLFDRSELDLYVAEDQERFKRGIPLLQATAEGVGGEGRYAVECGQQPIPADYARGAFFEGSIDALAGRFAQAIALGSGGTPVVGTSGSPVTFSIDPGITSFWVTALAPDGWELTSPSGNSISSEPGGSGGSLDGGDVAVTWTGPTFTAKVPVSDGGVGQWTLVRPGMSDGVGLYLFSDLALRITPVELVADEPVTISGQVVDAEGQAANLSVFSSADLRVTQIIDGEVVEDPTPFTLEAATGTFSGTFTPQTTSLIVQFDVTLSLTTASGYPLAPLTTTFVREVKLPGAYPALAPAKLYLGSLQNRGDQTTASLTATGSADGPTKVCVREVVTGPGLSEAQVQVTADSADGCIDLAAGESVTIPVTATLGSAVADGGQVSGEVILTVENAATEDLAARERPLTIPFTVQVQAVGPVLWVPFALTALGVVVPLLALYVLNWLAARLYLDGVMMARVPVTLEARDGAAVRRADDESGLLLTHEDFSFVAAPERARRWTPQSETLKARVPISPFGAVRAEVEAPLSTVVTSNVAPVSSKDGSRAGLSLNPSMNAYLLIDSSELAAARDDGSRIRAELVTFLVPADLARDASLLSSEIAAFPGWGAAVASLADSGLNHDPDPGPVHWDSAGDSGDGFPDPIADKWGLGDDFGSGPGSSSDPQIDPPPSGGGKNKFSF